MRAGTVTSDQSDLYSNKTELERLQLPGGSGRPENNYKFY